METDAEIQEIQARIRKRQKIEWYALITAAMSLILSVGLMPIFIIERDTVVLWLVFGSLSITAVATGVLLYAWGRIMDDEARLRVLAIVKSIESLEETGVNPF